MVGTFWFLGCNKTSFDKNPYDIAPEEEKTLPKPDDGTTPADHTAIDNYYIATGVLKDAGSFVGKTTGTSVSLGINQDIYASRTVLGNNVFKESYSFGVKKVGMQFYVSGKNYVMRDTSSLAAVDIGIRARHIRSARKLSSANSAASRWAFAIISSKTKP